MKNRVIIILFVLFQSFISFGKDTDVIIDGVFDARNIKWHNNVINLKGNADFYWKEFLVSTSPEDSLQGHKKLRAFIPKSWTKVKLNDDFNCPTQGYATYRIRIKVDNKYEVYGLKINALFTAYDLYVNGKLLSSVGKIGKSKDESVPKYKMKEIPIPVYKKDNVDYQVLDIVFHVSNYYHRRAGIQKPIYFSTFEEINSYTQDNLILHMFLVGLILVIGLNHLLMYVLRRLDITNLLFGLLSSIMILRDLSTGEYVLLHWFPNMNWEFLVRLDNFSGFGTMIFFALFFYYSYKKDFPKFIFYFLMILSIIITILVFSTNALFYGKFHLIFEAYVGLGGFYYTFGVLLVAAIRGRKGALISFIGMFMLYMTAINDVMNSMGVINTNDLATYGIAVFMFLQSYLLTKKSANALKDNKKLSKALKREKLNLEERIEERTQTLTQQSEELKKYQKEQEKQNWVNEGLNLITDVMRQNKEDYETLADQLLATLVKRVGASMGAMYLLKKIDSEDKLQLSADYGLNKDAKIDIIDVNEGLTGKCFSTGKENYIEEIPERYFSISSGLGSSTPKILALIPMRIDEFIIGVIEIASFKPIDDIHKSFLIRAIENISAQLNIVKMNKESQEMIAEYKLLEQEAKAKNQEMLENLEELKAIQEEAEKREEELNHILDNARKAKEDLKKKLQESIDKQAELKKRLVEAYKEIEKLKNSKRKK